MPSRAWLSAADDPTKFCSRFQALPVYWSPRPNPPASQRISHLQRLDAIHLAYSTEMNEPTQMVQTYIYYGYFVLVMNKLCTHVHVYFHETLLRQHWFCKCLKKNLQKIRFFFVLVSDEIFLFAPVRKGITHNASTTNTLCQNTTLYFSRALY